MTTIEEMKAQYEALNKKLEKQSIITERMMKEVMRARIQPAKLQYIVAICCGIYMLTVGLWGFRELGFSTPLLIYTVVLMSSCLIATIYIGRDVLSGSMLKQSMLEISKRAAKKIRLERNWLKISLPLGIAWAAWTCYEWCKVYNMATTYAFIFIICCSIGVFIGWRMDQKTIASYKALIRDIEDFTKE